MSDLAIKLGDRVRRFRKQRGLSQEELAHLASLHPTYIGQLERGEKNPTLETLSKITIALDITFEDLFYRIQPSRKEKNHKIINEILNKLLKRSIEDQKTVLNLLDILFKWKD